MQSNVEHDHFQTILQNDYQSTSFTLKEKDNSELNIIVGGLRNCN